MSKRVLIAGVLGGVAMFIWASVAHVALPLGSIGLTEITDDAALVASMRATIGNEHGLFFFPSGATSTDAASMEEYAKKIADGPSGLLLYHPSGAQALAPGQLVTEFLTEVLEALLAVILLAQTRLEAFGSRVGFITLAGILAALPTNVSYWNWYGFPGIYTASYILIQIAGFAIAGIVAAAMLKTRARAAAPVVA